MHPVTVEEYGEHKFRHDDNEWQRLALLAEDYNFLWCRNLESLGVGPGWRCLDVGAGRGVLARWMADVARVDEAVAVDKDTTYLRQITSDALTIVEADVTDERFSPGEFDLVHSRSTLFHIPRRFEVLKRMPSWLKPGGWLVLGDPIAMASGPTGHGTDPGFQKTMRAMWHALRETIGTDIDWVPTYPALFEELGLTDISWQILFPSVTPGSAAAGRWKIAWLDVRDAILATGMVSEEEFEEAIAYLSSDRVSETATGMMFIRGRRPLDPVGQ